MDATIAVFAPSVWVDVTIERDARGDDDVHLHPGGQGIWVARLLHSLGAQPIVCSPVGGEGGRAYRGLTSEWGIELRAVRTAEPSPVSVTERRDGQRDIIARSQPAVLSRHEVDELYNRTLETALAADVCVVTGQFPEPSLPNDFYRRLATDLEGIGVPVVGDLHGDELDAFLDAGSIDILKVSDGDLFSDGAIEEGDRSEDGAIAATAALVERGARAVVLSRSSEPIVARMPEGLFRISGPELAKVDSQGSGDSMTAVLAVGLKDHLDPEVLLARAWAAGAANITRRGSGGARPGLVDELAEHAVVERIDGGGTT